MSDQQSIVSELVPEAADHEPGSEEWAKVVASYLKSAIPHIGTPPEQILAADHAFKEHAGWKHLRDSKSHRPLKSQDDFCQRWLGLSSHEVINKLSRAEYAERLAQSPEITPTLSHSEAGKLGGRGHKASDKGTGFPRGSNAAATLMAKIKKLAPEVADNQIGPGKPYKSARAAAKDLGLIKSKPPLQRAIDAYQKLNYAEQAEFQQRVETETDSIELIISLWHGLDGDYQEAVMERLNLQRRPEDKIIPTIEHQPVIEC